MANENIPNQPVNNEDVQDIDPGFITPPRTPVPMEEEIAPSTPTNQIRQPNPNPVAPGAPARVRRVNTEARTTTRSTFTHRLSLDDESVFGLIPQVNRAPITPAFNKHGIDIKDAVRILAQRSKNISCKYQDIDQPFYNPKRDRDEDSSDQSFTTPRKRLR